MGGPVPVHRLSGSISTFAPDVNALDIPAFVRLASDNHLRIVWESRDQVLKKLNVVVVRMVGVEIVN